MKPNLLIAGCGKCGTTTLSYLLDQHPQVYMSKPKEPNFLSYDNVYNKGWEWYESIFLPGKGCKILGEASVSYTMKEYEKQVKERIDKYIPDLKVIYIARNPFKRFESVYKEHHHSGYEKGWLLPYTLHEAAEYRPEMMVNSLYWERTEYLRELLPEGNLLYLCLEDLIHSPNNFLNICLEFLGLEQDEEMDPEAVKKNSSSLKYYDRKLLRFLKRHKTFFNTQPALFIKLENKFLRKSFKNTQLYWDDNLKEYFINFMKKDVSNYLKRTNKPPDFWGKEFI